MALTYERCMEVATQAKRISENLKQAFLDATELLETNSDLAIDWAGDPKPAYLNEDASGNLDGFRFTRQNLANLIGSIDNFKKLLTNQAASQGDHLGNINLVANADV